MNASQLRCIAIDWSGAASLAGQRKHIWAADWNAGKIQLSSGRTRTETVAWLIEQASRTPALAVGLDFAFSYPAWFVEQQGGVDVEVFWEVVATRGEEWLASCDPPFWGKAGKRCPLDHRTPGWLGYRKADRIGGEGRQPKSAFQIGGAGSVGTGSIRGISALLALGTAGFSIWPFHAPSFPMAMEIYPRAFTGPVLKSSREARKQYLRTNFPDAAANFHAITPIIESAAIESEDAFDALCSVVGMARQAAEIVQLQQATHQVALLEGTIFPAKQLNPGNPA